MKIIRLDQYDIPGTGPTALASLMADSCCRPDRRPLFIPAGPGWECQIRAALRIDRLGKAISPRFASRYIGAWAPVCLLMRQGERQESLRASMRDDSLVVPAWLPLPPSGEYCSLRLDEETATYGFNEPLIGGLLSHLSAETTFKTGDIILLPAPLFTFIPERGTSVRVHASDQPKPVLDFNIR